jgi:hypothetical protein
VRELIADVPQGRASPAENIPASQRGTLTTT